MTNNGNIINYGVALVDSDPSKGSRNYCAVVEYGNRIDEYPILDTHGLFDLLSGLYDIASSNQLEIKAHIDETTVDCFMSELEQFSQQFKAYKEAKKEN